ncbi:MAG: BrnA antitoxin family protein [Elstera sp.]
MTTTPILPPKTPWVDPDDAPPITAEWIAEADLYHGETLIRRGRPPKAVRKKQITLRLDPDLVQAMRDSGKGWQSRVNSILRAAFPVDAAPTRTKD